MIDHYRMFAAYNAWANRLVHTAAAELDDAAFRKDEGAFFGSLHATLNHLLAADRVWMKRFTGTGDAPTSLNAILHDTLAELRTARTTEDRRISDWIDTLGASDLASTFTFTPITVPQPVTQTLGPCLAHLFNHQTHHRGQCHMILTRLGQPSLVLDLAYFLRAEEGRRFAS